jgi:hypothetical protein
VGIITEDVVLQSESAEDEKDVAAPLGVVGRLQIKNDGDQVLDVLDSGGLAVQMSNGRSFGAVVVTVHGVVVPEGSDLLFQDVSLRTLLVKSSSGGTDVFLGSGG